MFTPTSKDFNGCIDILLALNVPPNYNGHHKEALTKTEKLAFTTQIAVIIFELVAYEQENKLHFTEYPTVHLSNLPRIALYHALIEYGERDILSATYQELFGKHKDLERAFHNYTKQQVTALTSEAFYNYVSKFNNELELTVYEASAALADYYATKASNMCDRQLLKLNDYKGLPIIREFFKDSSENSQVSKLRKLFEDFLSQKNIIRWRPFRPIRTFSVLGHSFNVAVYNYLLLLNENPHNPGRADLGFFVGLYHDIPEIWTGDIPSPLKKVIPMLNETIEQLEVAKLESKVFGNLPDWLVPKFKQFMLELLPEEDKSCYKRGDSFDSYIEASKLLEAPSARCYMEHVVLNGVVKAESASPIIRNALKKLCKDANISTTKVYFFKLKNKISQLFKLD